MSGVSANDSCATLRLILGVSFVPATLIVKVCPDIALPSLAVITNVSLASSCKASTASGFGTKRYSPVLFSWQTFCKETSRRVEMVRLPAGLLMLEKEMKLIE